MVPTVGLARYLPMVPVWAVPIDVCKNADAETMQLPSALMQLANKLWSRKPLLHYVACGTNNQHKRARSLVNWAALLSSISSVLLCNQGEITHNLCEQTQWLSGYCFSGALLICELAALKYISVYIVILYISSAIRVYILMHTCRLWSWACLDIKQAITLSFEECVWCSISLWASVVVVVYSLHLFVSYVRLFAPWDRGSPT